MVKPGATTLPRQQNLRPKCMSHGSDNTGHRDISAPRDWSLLLASHDTKGESISIAPYSTISKVEPHQPLPADGLKMLGDLEGMGMHLRESLIPWQGQ